MPYSLIQFQVCKLTYSIDCRLKILGRKNPVDRQDFCTHITYSMSCELLVIVPLAIVTFQLLTGRSYDTSPILYTSKSQTCSSHSSYISITLFHKPSILSDFILGSPSHFTGIQLKGATSCPCLSLTPIGGNPFF